MKIIVFVSAFLMLWQEPPRPPGGSKETVWGWQGNGVNVLFKLFDSVGKKYVRCEMYQGDEQIVLAHDSMEVHHEPGTRHFQLTGPTQVKFCAKNDNTFAVFLYNDSTGSMAFREFSIPERKELEIPTFVFESSETLEGMFPCGRGNAVFHPTEMLKRNYYPNRDPFDFTFDFTFELRKPGIDVEMELITVARESERWLVTMKIDKEKHVFYRADREAIWHLQMSDDKDWLANDPVLCGSAKIQIDGEEKTVQLWNQIAVRQNVEQQIASYKIPDINFMWVDLVNADGSTRRIWDAPESELTFGTIVNSGFIACFDESKSQIVFAFRDRFRAVEYYEASAGQNLPKSNVLSRTQSYIQRADGRGCWPGPERYGRNMPDELSGVSMAQPEVRPLQLLRLQPMADRMQLEASVNGKILVLEIKDDEQEWKYRLDLQRPFDEDRK